MASILPNGRVQFIDQNGKPLVGGSVTFYSPGTTTKKDTYQDSALTILNTNPIILDSRGQATIWGNGSYRQVVADSLSVTIWDQVVSAAVASDALAGTGGAGMIGMPDGSNLANAFLLSLNRVVDSIAALRATNHTFYQRAFVTGYYSAHDGGGGAYQYDASDTSSADNGGTIIVAADGGRWKLSNTTPVTTKQFGAKGDGTTLDDVAVANWWGWCSLGNPGYVSKGTYKMGSPMSWDVKNSATTGVLIDGAGTEQAYFDLTGVSGQPFKVINSAGGGAFYSKFENFGIRTNYNGVGCMIGQENLADELNVFTFEVYVNNVNTGASACATELNFVVNSHFRNCVFNCAGATVGEALRLRRGQFNTFEGGSFSNALISCHLTNDYNFGNTWYGPDFEVSGTNVVIDSAQSANNSWFGGQWQWTAASINGTAGNNNRFFGNNFASAGAVVSGSTGIIVYGPKAIGTEQFGGMLLSPPSGDGAITINSVAANSDDINLQQAGVTRWSIVRDTSANLIINLYNSSGTLVGQPLVIEPSQGVATLSKASISGVGFFGAGVSTTRPTVTGSRGGNAAVASILNALATLGLITDSTSA
ncbi:hypothetical protein DF047_17090 [Burkholderia cenocepacia]|uniref:hypothetical protein n=1 Tax=Burkholderia cenocepacia TaxID=95486 RepID=UPI000F5C1039|nr:hypothetical protein [Burkholderia cenocepacia]RQV06934.1 hypothetical protein DF047_17090 [Burkholderia cenocepacia]